MMIIVVLYCSFYSVILRPSCQGLSSSAQAVALRVVYRIYDVGEYVAKLGLRR